MSYIYRFCTVSPSTTMAVMVTGVLLASVCIAAIPWTTTFYISLLWFTVNSTVAGFFEAGKFYTYDILLYLYTFT